MALEEIAKYHETHNHLKGLEIVEKLSEVETGTRLPKLTGAELLLPQRCALLPSSWPGETKRNEVCKAVPDFSFLHALQPLAIFAVF